jgi:hypothetical protein
MSNIFPIIFIVLGLYMLITGLRGVITNKPFMFSAKINFWLVAVAFSPSIIQALYSFVADAEGFDWSLYSFLKILSSFELSDALLLLFPLLIYVVTLAFIWRQMRGYTVLGVTDESFRQALYAVLEDLRLPFEERLSKLRLTSLDADLEASVASWMGVANLRIKQREHQEIIERVAEGLNRYFAGSHVSVNMVTCVYYIILGALVMASAGILAGFIWH